MTEIIVFEACFVSIHIFYLYLNEFSLNWIIFIIEIRYKLKQS